MTSDMTGSNYPTDARAQPLNEAAIRQDERARLAQLLQDNEAVITSFVSTPTTALKLVVCLIRIGPSSNPMVPTAGEATP